MISEFFQITGAAIRSAIRAYFRPIVAIYRYFVPERRKPMRLTFASVSVIMVRTTKPVIRQGGSELAICGQGR